MKGLVIVLVAVLISAVTAQEDLDALCVNVKDGAFIGYPNSCIEWIQCAYGKVYDQGACDKPYGFIDGQCTYPIGECADYWVTTEAPEVPLTNNCTVGKLYYERHVNYCDKYVLCYNGVPKLQTCGEGMEFSETELTCVKAADSGCLVNPCPAEDSEDPYFFPSKTDCSIYFICFNGLPQEFKCTEDNVFNQEKNTCTPRANTNVDHCEAVVTEAPVTEAPVTEAPVTEAPVTDATSATDEPTDPVTDETVTEEPVRRSWKLF